MQQLDHMTKDIGRKCASDVSGAMRRNIMLADDIQGMVAISAYGAAAAIGLATGMFAQKAGAAKGERITAAMIDELWINFIRPIAVQSESQV
jgi:hypothetical protein